MNLVKRCKSFMHWRSIMALACFCLLLPAFPAMNSAQADDGPLSDAPEIYWNESVAEGGFESARILRNRYCNFADTSWYSSNVPDDKQRVAAVPAIVISKDFPGSFYFAVHKSLFITFRIKSVSSRSPPVHS